MPRKTHLDVSAWTLDGNSFLGLFKNASIDLEAITQPGRAVSQRHQLAIPVKKKMAFSIEELITSTGGSAIRQSNLNVTVFTVGGTSHLATLDSGTLKVMTDTKDGSADADEWEYAYALGTDYEITAELFVATAAQLMSTIAAAGVSGLLVAVALTLGGTAFAAPMTLTADSHTTGEGDFQKVKITLKGRGTPTTATGNTLLVSILTGTAALAYSMNTGANTYAGNAIIKDTTINWANSQLITASHSFEGCDAPTIT
jgi:hypothetical protein